MSDVIVSEENDRVIGSSLKDKCVIEAKRIVRKVNGVLVPTESFVLTFPKTLPTRVTFAYMSFPMPPFVYRPMQCKNCHRIGHKAKHCIHPACCAMCWDSPPMMVPIAVRRTFFLIANWQITRRLAQTAQGLS